MDRTVNILKKPLTMTLIAIFFGFVVAGIILAAAGYPPVHSLGVLFNGVFSSPKHVSNVIIKSTPLILTGLGVAFAFKDSLISALRDSLSWVPWRLPWLVFSLISRR